jgi:hypothetical protein
MAKVKWWPLLRNREPGLEVHIRAELPRENLFPGLDSPCYDCN